jgi:predicted ribosome quality control (RQC) complex YloA/Tae2 family protein
LKETLTSFDIAAATHEINKLVEGAHVVKVYQTGMQTLLFKLRKPDNPRIQLLFEAGKRVHLTAYAHETPKRPSVFCMTLRKYLDNGVVKAVKQHEFERVVNIIIATREGDYQLVVELFGGGNVILVDPAGKILQAMTYKRMRDRNIIRGETFQQPPARGKNPLVLQFEDFKEIQTFDKTEVVRALTKLVSISGTYAEEFLLRAGVDKKTPCNRLTDVDVETVFGQLKTVLDSVSSGNLEPRIVCDENGEWVDVTPLPLKQYDGFEQTPCETFNNALDEYFAKITDAELIQESSGEAVSEAARYMRVLQKQQKALEDLKEPIAKNKAIGDMIYLHFGELQALFQKVLTQKHGGKSWEQIAANLEQAKKVYSYPELYFHSLETKNQLLFVTFDNQVFSLLLNKSIQANADEYYQASKKAEKKLEGAQKTLQETLDKIKKAEKQVKKVKEAQQPLAIRRKREWYEKFRWFISSDGFLVIGGRDATTNELIVKKRMDTNDIIFHAEIVGAPFVLIKTEGKTVPEQTINEAAQLAASYSRAWKENFEAVDVYWVHPDQVSKTPPSGQSLKKGSFMIRGTKNFVRGVSMRVALGIKIEDDQVYVIGGPMQAVASQTRLYMEVIQGTQKSGEIAKKVRHVLSEKVDEEMKRAVTAVPLEEFQSFIPLGRGKLK